MEGNRSNINSTSYGGIIPILKKLKDWDIAQTIKESLGDRKKQSRYEYHDIFIAWILTSLCGGRRLDHITDLHKHLSHIPGLKLPSHDTLGRVMKKLATEESKQKESIVLKSGKKVLKSVKVVLNEYDDNLMMNKMLVKVTKQAGILKEKQRYTLHIDATFIETCCFEAVRAVKQSGRERSGFHPMVCFIDNLPVYVCMRNGNSNAKFNLKDSLVQCLDILSENNIIVDKVISDGAAYDREVTNMLQQRGIKFNIHAPFNWTFKGMMNSIDAAKNWKKVEIETGHNFRNCEITEFPYTMTHQKNVFRLIVARTLTKKGRELFEDNEEKQRRKMIEKKMDLLLKRNMLKQGNKAYSLGKWKEHKYYKYKVIISNDPSLPAEQLLVEYNKRGNAERQFDFMKNGFGWRFPPFMKMNQNTIFMIAAALANNIFRAVVSSFKEKLPTLKETIGIRKFKSYFIEVICDFIDGICMFHKSKIAYEKLM